MRNQIKEFLIFGRKYAYNQIRAERRNNTFSFSRYYLNKKVRVTGCIVKIDYVNSMLRIVVDYT